MNHTEFILANIKNQCEFLSNAIWEYNEHMRIQKEPAVEDISQCNLEIEQDKYFIFNSDNKLNVFLESNPELVGEDGSKRDFMLLIGVGLEIVSYHEGVIYAMSTNALIIKDIVKKLQKHGFEQRGIYLNKEGYR